MARKLLTNARVVMPGEMFLGTVEWHAGRIVRIDIGATSLPGAEDLGGDLLLPGLVDLLPARTAITDPDGLVAADAFAAACGVVTVVDAAPCSAASGGGSPATDVIRWIESARMDGTLRCDHRLRLHADHGARPETLRTIAGIAGPSLQLVSAAASTPSLLRALADAARPLGLVPAVTDTSSADDARGAIDSGVRLLLAPGAQALSFARAQGAGSVLRVAPRSTATRVPSSLATSRSTPAEAIGSGGRPYDLLRLAFTLRDGNDWTLPEAVGAVTLRPARFAGFTDRGALLLGQRADFVRVREAGGAPHPIATWRAGERVA